MKLIGSLQTGPTIEPVTVAEAQAHLIINGQEEYITGLIKAARIQVERYLNRSLIVQTWRAYADCWDRELILPHGPLLSVSSLQYVGQNDLTETVASSDYWVDAIYDRIILAYDYTPPMLKEGRPSSVIANYTAGYRAAGTDEEKRAAIPDDIRHAIKILITDMHEHRGQYAVGNDTSKIPGMVNNLLHPHRLYYSF